MRALLNNRVYAGVIEALKTEAVEPKFRRTPGHGRTSRRAPSADERISLVGLVSNPVVTEEEFEVVQQQFRHNQRYASRNSQREYLLRGLIRCQRCSRTYGGITRID